MRFDSRFSIRIKDALAARVEPEAHTLLARTFWAGCVVLVALITVCAIGYGVWEFMQNPQRLDEQTPRAQATFTRSELEAVLDGFDVRAKQFEERLDERLSVPDPS